MFLKYVLIPAKKSEPISTLTAQHQKQEDCYPTMPSPPTPETTFSKQVEEQNEPKPSTTPLDCSNACESVNVWR
jgi:hypothetical protein